MASRYPHSCSQNTIDIDELQTTKRSDFRAALGVLELESLLASTPSCLDWIGRLNLAGTVRANNIFSKSISLTPRRRNFTAPICSDIALLFRFLRMFDSHGGTGKFRK
jgi:hypothetical protein